MKRSALFFAVVAACGPPRITAECNIKRCLFRSQDSATIEVCTRVTVSDRHTLGNTKSFPVCAVVPGGTTTESAVNWPEIHKPEDACAVLSPEFCDLTIDPMEERSSEFSRWLSQSWWIIAIAFVLVALGAITRRKTTP